MNCRKCHKELPLAIERLGKDLCYLCYQKDLRKRKWYREQEKQDIKKALEKDGRYEDEFIIIN